MDKKQENTSIWNYASTVPKSAIKENKEAQGPKLSICGYWMFEKATEIWGPVGTGWGYIVKEERLDKGAPIFHEKKLLEGEALILAYETTHTIEAILWYMSGERKIELTSFGHTKYIYRTNNGKFKTDNEAPKKSLTDAIKKALSMTGIGSDIFKNMYEDSDYRESVQAEIEIQEAEEKQPVIDQKIEEIKNSITSNVELIKTSSTPNEAKKLAHGISMTLGKQQRITELKDVASYGLGVINKHLNKKLSELSEKKGDK